MTEKFFYNKGKWNFEKCTLLVYFAAISYQYLHAKYISGGSQAIKVKVYPPSTNKHIPRLAESMGTVHTNIIPRGVLFNYLQFEFGTGNPYYHPLVQAQVNKDSS